MSNLDQLFEQFIRERTYVHNVTPKARDWYQSAWHAFKQSQSHSANRAVGSSPSDDRADLRTRI
jgi:hypothetical protein